MAAILNDGVDYVTISGACPASVDHERLHRPELTSSPAPLGLHAHQPRQAP
jgi:hypothetical protein